MISGAMIRFTFYVLLVAPQGSNWQTDSCPMRFGRLVHGNHSADTF